ncbi:DUF885 domain-containing protein [bacterium]|nr:DUF885 domain-containing protein [bacterium]
MLEGMRTPWLALLMTVSLVISSETVLAQPLPPPINRSEQLNQLFDQAYDEILHRSPVELTRQGSRDRNFEWDDLGPAEPRMRARLMRRWAEKARQLASGQSLDAETKLSLQLFLARADLEEKSLEFADYDYPVNQMYGWHAEVPAFLSNAHKVGSRSDAVNYLRRLESLPAFFDQLVEGLRRRQKNGILPPLFVFDYVLSDIDNLLVGFPLSEAAEPVHPIYADFLAKLKNLQLSRRDEEQLRQRAQAALRNGFRPAYENLRQVLLEQRAQAGESDGVWKFPNGQRFYAHQLETVTTTSMSAEQIHQLGLSEVARIHAEMRAILTRLKFEGSLSDFFQFMRSDPRFLYSNDEAGKAAYLKEATAIVDRMRGQLDKLFLTQPKALLVVKPVESYREKSAGKAFYEAPALDGSRDGFYYANLYDMSSMPKYQMEALAYHEAIPGHHMQISIAQELRGIPKFRRMGGYTAYVEGWGLYCEQLPKEHGFYQDPYSDFGRLSMELFRAVRLVVDTGIHQQRWTRAQGLQYYLDNTPNSPLDCKKMVDRHIVMPAQATAYKIGMLEILRLRAKAQKEMGARFDLRKFHDVVLVHGAVPLKVLEKLVTDHISDSKDEGS